MNRNSIFVSIVLTLSVGLTHCEALESCFSKVDKCNKIGRCKLALEGIDSRCKVTAGKCSAGMHDITRCGLIMDHLFSYGFGTDPCECPENSPECLKVQQTINSNPCFGAIQHLRKYNLYPKEIDAYDRANIYESTTSSVTSHIAVIHKQNTGSETTQSSSTARQVVGSKRRAIELTPSVVKPVASNEDNKVIRKTKSKERARWDRKKSFKEIQTSTNHPMTKSERMVPSKNDIVNNDLRSKPSTIRNRILNERKSGRIQKQISRGMQHNEISKKVNDTDYKTIAIILGILLALFVISLLIIFLWTRTNNMLVYKGAKFIQDHRNSDEIFSRIQFPSSLTQNQLHV